MNDIRKLTDSELGELTVNAFNYHAKSGGATFADARTFAAMWNHVKVSTVATVISFRDAPRIPFAVPFVLIVDAA